MAQFCFHRHSLGMTQLYDPFRSFYILLHLISRSVNHDRGETVPICMCNHIPVPSVVQNQGHRGMDASPLEGNTLILVHETIRNPKISDKRLLDDVMIEVDWEGKILWKWSISDHFDELGFDEAAKNVLFRDPNMRQADGGVGDYLHVNCMSYLGPNKWHDQGDMRFKPGLRYAAPMLIFISSAVRSPIRRLCFFLI